MQAAIPIESDRGREHADVSGKQDKDIRIQLPAK
jgi:hypothetical protein